MKRGGRGERMLTGVVSLTQRFVHPDKKSFSVNQIQKNKN
jgi:hypothetical protein